MSNFRRSSQAWKKRLKHWTYTCTCGFSQHYFHYFHHYFYFHLGCNVFLPCTWILCGFALAYKTPTEKCDVWIYDFTWKHLKLWVFFVNKKFYVIIPYEPCILGFDSPPTSLLYYQYKKKETTEQVHKGMEPAKPDGNDHHNTFTPSLHLVPFCQLCTPQTSLHYLAYTKWTRCSAVLYIFTHKRQSMYSSNIFSQHNFKVQHTRPRGSKFEVVHCKKHLVKMTVSEGYCSFRVH